MHHRLRSGLRHLLAARATGYTVGQEQQCLHHWVPLTGDGIYAAKWARRTAPSLRSVLARVVDCIYSTNCLKVRCSDIMIR